MNLDRLKKLIEEELKELSLNDNRPGVKLGRTSDKPASINKPLYVKSGLAKDAPKNRIKKQSKWAKKRHYLKAFNENLKKNNNEVI